MKKNKFFSKINIFSSILVILLFIFSVYQLIIFTNNLNFLKQIEKEIKKISKENQRMEEELVKTDYLSNLDEFLRNENFVKAERLKYIQIFEGAVLAK